MAFPERFGDMRDVAEPLLDTKTLAPFEGGELATQRSIPHAVVARMSPKIACDVPRAQLLVLRAVPDFIDRVEVGVSERLTLVVGEVEIRARKHLAGQVDDHGLPWEGTPAVSYTGRLAGRRGS